MARDELTALLILICIGWSCLVGWFILILYRLSVLLGVFEPLEVLRESDPLMGAFVAFMLAAALMALFYIGVLIADHLIMDKRLMRKRR